MKIVPVSYRLACEFIEQHHRHHRPPQGHKFSIGLEHEGSLVGVVCVGRPVSRFLDDGTTAEVTRLCTTGVPNSCSMLYAASSNSAKAMGYRRIITYILETETGASLKASGWKFDVSSEGGSWSSPSRKRNDKHPLIPKQRWAKELSKNS
jgi:hypothetical protein